MTTASAPHEFKIHVGSPTPIQIQPLKRVVTKLMRFQIDQFVK